MRKFYLINALMLLLTLFSSAGISAAVTTYPYSPDFKSDDGWTKTATGKGSWSRSNGYWQAKITTGDSKAYLFSPELQTESGSRYTFTYTFKVGSTRYPNEKFTVYILKSATATSQQLYSKDYELNLDKQSITDSFSFDSTDDSPIYFCVYDWSNGSSAYMLDFTSFKVEKSILETKPNMVTGLTAERGANEAMTVALGWTNPATYNTGESLSIKQINIYRNDVLLKSLTDAASTASGAAVSLTDEVPASGYYTYGVEIVDADGKKSATASVRTAYVGPLAAIAPPYTLDFSDAEEMAFWKTINGDNTNNWSIKVDHAEIKADGNKSNDDWFVSRPFALDAAKAYKLSFTSAFSNPANEFNLDVMMGSGVSAEAMTEQIANVKAEKDKKTVVTEKAFSPKSTGTAYIGWHADNAKYSATYYYNTLSLSDISIVEIPVVPNIATGVKATPATDGAISVALEWTNPTTSETGLPLTNLSAEIYRDGALVKTIAAAGAKGSFTDTESDGLTKGFHKYYIVIKNGNGATSAEPETVESGFVGVPETVPFVSDFANESSLWTVEDNSKTSTKKSFTFTGGKAVITESSNSDFNDWLITPPVSMKAGKTYRVTVNGMHNGSSYSSASVELKLGKSNSSATMTTSVGSSSLSNVAKDFGKEYAVEADGAYCLGIHINDVGYRITTVTVNSVTIEEIATIAKPVTAASAKSVGEEMKVELKWTMPAESTLGKALTSKLTARVLKDDAEIASIADLEPGSEASFIDENASTGINRYSIIAVTPTNDDALGGDSEPVSLDSDWTGECKHTPFVSDFVNEQELWTVIDDSGTTNPEKFEFVDGHAQLFERNGKADADKSLTNTMPDDYLITPAIALEAGKTYSVTVNAACGASSGSSRPFRMLYGLKNDKDGLTAKITPSTDPKLSGNAFNDYTYEFSVNESGKYFIGFYLPYSYTSYAAFIDVASITVEEAKTLPAVVENASVAGTGTDNTAVVKFTMPSLSTVGAALTATLNARIYRDGDVVATLSDLVAGQEVTYNDMEVGEGYHTYKIAAVTTGAMGGEGEAVEVASPYIGAAKTVPFESDFAAKSNLWTVINNSWSGNNTFEFVNGEATATESSSTYFNDWLITPPVKVETGHTYRVSLRAKVDSGKKSFALKYGSEPTVDGVKAHTITSSGEIVSTDFETIGFDFRPETSGIFYVGLNVMSSGDAKTVSVSDFDIIIAPVTPKTVDNLSVEAVGLENKAKVSFKMPAESTMGDVLTGKLSAVVSRNGAVVSTLADLDPKQSVEVTDEVDAAGEYTYSVVAVTPDTADALGDTSAAATVESGWIGKGIEPPYANRFDSESDIDGWSVASTYSYGTINWNYNKEKGCMQLRPVAYGDKEFWLISKPLCLEKAGIYRLTFDAWMQSEAADLFVYVSSSPDYKTMTTQIGEPYYLIVATQSPEIVFSTAGNADASTPGDISSDAGNYYLGFMATEISNYSNVYLDNIEIEPIVTSTVHTLSGEDMKMYVSNDVLHIVSDTDTDIDNIQIYAMSGLMLAAADNTNEISLQHLPAGAYVVKIKTDKQIITSKIIK